MAVDILTRPERFSAPVKFVFESLGPPQALHTSPNLPLAACLRIGCLFLLGQIASFCTALQQQKQSNEPRMASGTGPPNLPNHLPQELQQQIMRLQLSNLLVPTATFTKLLDPEQAAAGQQHEPSPQLREFAASRVLSPRRGSGVMSPSAERRLARKNAREVVQAKLQFADERGLELCKVHYVPEDTLQHQRASGCVVS